MNSDGRCNAMSTGIVPHPRHALPLEHDLECFDTMFWESHYWSAKRSKWDHSVALIFDEYFKVRGNSPAEERRLGTNLNWEWRLEWMWIIRITVNQCHWHWVDMRWSFLGCRYAWQQTYSLSVSSSAPVHMPLITLLESRNAWVYERDGQAEFRTQNLIYMI